MFLWVVIKTFGQSADDLLLGEPEQFDPHRFRTPKIRKILGGEAPPLAMAMYSANYLFCNVLHAVH